jgi:hypothetical protein
MHQRTDSASERPDDVPWTTPTTWCRHPSRTDQPGASGDRQLRWCFETTSSSGRATTRPHGTGAALGVPFRLPRGVAAR